MRSLSPNMQRIIFLIAVTAILASIALRSVHALWPYILMPIRPPVSDIDWLVIDRALQDVHGISDTAKWWSGQWCHSLGYWRPLSSYAFWGMRMLWPTRYMLPRQIMLVAGHLLFTLLGGLLLWRLTGRKWLTWITVWLFAGLRPFPISWVFEHGQLTVGKVLTDPKNLPDAFMSIMVMVSLLLLQRGKWVAALIAAMMAACFKETGFVTWPLAIVMFAWIRWEKISRASIVQAMKRNRPAIIIWVLALGFMLLARTQAVGMTTGIRWNRFTILRMALFFGGPIIGEFAIRDWSVLIVSGLAIVAVLGFRRFSLLPKFIGILASLALGVLIDTRLQGTTWDVSLARLFGFDLDLSAIAAIWIWVYVASKGAKDLRTIGFALAMSFAASIPTWSAWAAEHSRYMSAFFLEVAVAAAICQAGQVLLRAGTRWRMVASDAFFVEAAVPECQEDRSCLAE